MARTSALRIAASVAVAAGAGFVLRRTAVAVGSRRSVDVDARVRRSFRSIRSDAGDVVSLVVTACAAPALLMSTTLLTAFFLRHRGRAVSFPLAAAPFSAMALGALFTHFLPQQSAPDSEGWEPCFPSGHTTGMTAELMTLSYFLRREGIIGDPGAIAIAAFCVPGGLNRLYRDRHWASDIVAGWSAGLFVAASCIAVSELSLMRKDAGHSPASSVPDLTAL